MVVGCGCTVAKNIRQRQLPHWRRMMATLQQQQLLVCPAAIEKKHFIGRKLSFAFLIFAVTDSIKVVIIIFMAVVNLAPAELKHTFELNHFLNNSSVMGVAGAFQHVEGKSGTRAQECNSQTVIFYMNIAAMISSVFARSRVDDMMR